MQPKLWQAEETVSSELAFKLIQTQFPNLAPLTLELLGAGWDNTAYLVNKQFVFRFPRRQIAVDLIELETRVLPKIAQQLPLPVPNPIFLGQPCEDYVWPFSGYELLAGQTACRAHLTSQERCQIAKPLGEFLKALHSLKEEAPDDKLKRLNVEMRWPAAHQNLTQIKQLGFLSHPKHLFDLLESLKEVRNQSQHKVLCHGDFYARHLLINSKRQLCGIIDWGDVHLGPPAIDLAILFSFLPQEAQADFLKAYGPIDKNTEQNALFRALYSASLLAVYAHDVGDTDLLQEALFALNQNLNNISPLEHQGNRDIPNSTNGQG
ncbi:MAG: phosphotransferase [Myxococcaceae bacterium]